MTSTLKSSRCAIAHATGTTARQIANKKEENARLDKEQADNPSLAIDLLSQVILRRIGLVLLNPGGEVTQGLCELRFVSFPPAI